MSGADGAAHLARRLGPFDATMLVMGGIIGAGIFVNPAEVARQVDTPGLSYVVSVDFIWFGLTGAALFVYRRRDPASPGFRAPLHPWSTGLFVIACAAIVVATVAAHPANSAIGLGILLAGVPACLYWLRRKRIEAAQ